MAAHTDAVAAALAAVDEDRFVRRANGSLVTQSTAAEAIAGLLDRLDVRRGMAVLEIGTGSGYSTALLAELAGPDGRITSVDVVPELVTRARDLLRGHGATTATVICRDGLRGAAEHGQFDRVVAWTTATHVPAPWVHQLRPGGRIVAPVALSTLSKTGAGVVVEIAGRSEPVPSGLLSARYVEMHHEVLTQWLVPPYGADVVRPDPDGRPWWLSAEQFRDPATTPAGRAVLDRLADHGYRAGGPLRAGESADDFRAWLLATRPPGLCTAALGDPDWRIGLVDAAGGAALMSTRDGTDTVVAGDRAPADALAAGAERWRAAGRPGLADLAPRLTPSREGWTVSAEPPDQHRSR